MPRVTHVKKARKDNSCVKKGESYYWWKFRFGGKHMSKTYPRPSQLTQSEFLGQMYDLQDRLSEVNHDNVSDAQSEVEEIADELRTLGEECEEKADNMPENLTDSPVAEMLRERNENCEEMADELESVDWPDEYSVDDDGNDPDEDGISDEEKEEREERLAQFETDLEEAIQSAKEIEYNGE